MTNRMFAGETLDTLLDELTDLALSSPLSGTFFQSILEAAIKATSARAGAIWSVADINYRLEQEIGLVRLGIGSNSQLQALHEDALECATKGQIAMNAAPDVTQRSYEGRMYRFFGCRDHDFTYLVIELVHDENAVDQADHGLVARFMAALSEIARDFRNAQALQRLQHEDKLWGDFKSILPNLHSSIHLDESAYKIANEGRKFLQCDRLSVARIDRDKASIIAVSGVATVEKRAKQVRELQSLVAIVARSGNPLRHPSNEIEAPQLSDGLQRYLDASHCERIWVCLIFDIRSNSEHLPSSGQRCIGALIIEDFEVKNAPDLAQRSELLLQHAGLSLQNALQYDRLAFRRLSESLQGWDSIFQKFRLKLIGGCAAACIGFFLAIVIPSDLNIDAKGTIQPIAMRHLYAPANGEVVQIHTTHQSKVQEGALLLEIRSRELELRKEELLTLCATTQEKLRSIEVARLQNRKTSTPESMSSGELSATERELREVMASQQEQLLILNDMLVSLQLRSPVNGQVISWNPIETLEHRPVQQGQKLISVAELDGAGKLQLRVLDEDTRHVIKAYRRGEGTLRVTFAIASDPGVKRSAVVHRIGTTIETVSEDGATLRIDATVAAAEMANVRPGATVNARIHCGRACVGYVWTRRFWDFMLFHFL
ncbi:MAG: efflux RND transporter periplasmic adaptor subunit [Pirellula sp.]